MAISMSLYCYIVQKGLDAQRDKDVAEMQRLFASGVDKQECIRRVLFPRKTPEQYRQINAEYERGFGGGLS